MEQKIQQLEDEISRLKKELAQRDRELLRFYQQVGFDNMGSQVPKRSILDYE
jgi:hypothetical protein